MAGMDAYAHLLGPGDTGTVMFTGTVRDIVTDGKGWGMASVSLPGGTHADVLLPERPGVRLLAGDLTPTLVSALEHAIEHLGPASSEWMAPQTLDLVERYERALDALRGGFIEEETSAGHRA